MSYIEPYFKYLRMVLVGPQIYRIHNTYNPRDCGFFYKPNTLESRTQSFLNFMSSLKFIVYYTSPLWLAYMLKNGCFGLCNFWTFGYCSASVSVAVVLAMLGRTVGRLQNREYVNFVELVNQYKMDRTPEILLKVKDYDFDFTHMPVDFKMSDAQSKKRKYNISSLARRIKENPKHMPRELASFFIAHTFGIRMIYPGFTQVLKSAYANILIEHRGKLIEDRKGYRAKLQAADGNYIDTVFVDERPRSKRLIDEPNRDIFHVNGKTLVICCEGNAGYYEVGCMTNPLEAGFSVLGWNHPGFGSSTGIPFPDAEKNAIDVVIQYALQELKFSIRDIVVFAWSIGGYTASHAAKAYPNIKGLVLDATFYDIMPFATKMMPEFLNELTTYTIRSHLNLCNSENMENFQGDVRVIRRTKDEVMNLDGMDDVKSNMCNMLIENILWKRYPNLLRGKKASLEVRGEGDEFSAMWQWLRANDEYSRESIMRKWEIEQEDLLEELRYEKSLFPAKYPLEIGKDFDLKSRIRALMFLLDNYVTNVETTHCAPLPQGVFREAWNCGTFESPFDDLKAEGRHYEADEELYNFNNPNVMAGGVERAYTRADSLANSTTVSTVSKASLRRRAENAKKKSPAVSVQQQPTSKVSQFTSSKASQITSSVVSQRNSAPPQVKAEAPEVEPEKSPQRPSSMMAQSKPVPQKNTSKYVAPAQSSITSSSERSPSVNSKPTSFFKPVATKSSPEVSRPGKVESPKKTGMSLFGKTKAIKKETSSSQATDSIAPTESSSPTEVTVKPAVNTGIKKRSGLLSKIKPIVKKEAFSESSLASDEDESD